MVKLRKKNAKKMAKKFSQNITKILSKVNSALAVSKKLVLWPLGGALAHESKNKLQSGEKNAGPPRAGLFYFFI